MIYKKKVLWLIAIAIVMVIVSVACSGNPTNAGDYIVAKQAEQSPKPEMKLTVDTNQGLIQFKDLSFKSGAYYINGNYTKKIYYYADIKVDENSKPYISAITKSEDGEIIEEEGKFYETSTNESGEFYNLEGVRYQSGNKLTAEATFDESGYLVIRFSNYSLDITYSLIEETPEEISDEISDGTYIPKVFWGFYDLVVDSYNTAGGATVTSNCIRYSGEYYIDKGRATYLGQNTWSMTPSKYGEGPENTDIKKFERNEGGQRVLIDLKLNNKYTNIYIHQADR